MAKSTDDIADMLTPGGGGRASSGKTPNKKQSGNDPVGVQPYSYDDADYDIETTPDESEEMAQRAANAAKGLDTGASSEPGAEY